MPLKYFLSRNSAGSGRLLGDNFMTFLGSFYKTILIILTVEEICLIITLWNRLNLCLSRIIGFGVQIIMVNINFEVHV